MSVSDGWKPNCLVVSRSRPNSSDEVANRPSFEERVSPNAPASIFNIPREIQLFLFSFFTHEEMCKTLAPVCLHWWELSKDPSLWKSLKIVVDKKDETRSLSSLLLRSPMLTKLSIETMFHLEEFAVYSRWCPKLTHLDLSFCRNLNHLIMALFVQNCPLIEELKVVGCDIEEKAVSSIVSLQHLRVLDISYCKLIDDNCIQLISKNCKQLENVEIGSNTCTDKAIRSLTENLHQTLLRLAVRENHENATINMTDLALSRIGLCTRLQHLIIEDGDDFTDQLLESLKMLTNLRTLILRHATSISAIAINEHFAGSHVHNLVKLNLLVNTINDDGVYNITKNCRFLRKLSLLDNCEVTEVGIEHIVKHCKYLTHLELQEMDHVTLLCLQSVPRNLSCLEFLTLIRCGGVIESVLVDLKVRVPKLKLKVMYSGSNEWQTLT